MRDDIELREKARRLVCELINNGDSDGPWGVSDKDYIMELRAALDEDTCHFCEYEAVATVDKKPLCDSCYEGYIEDVACEDDIDHHGDRDKTPEELAGEVFEDKLAMYRNEH